MSRSETSTITVTARDAGGNPIEGATVVLSSDGSNNTIVDPVGSTNASGVAQGTIASTVAEVKTITATVNGVAITQKPTVTVNPGAAATIAWFVHPEDAAPLETLAPVVVRALDSFGNVATSFTGTISISIDPPTGLLGGTLSRAAVNGSATFDDLTVTIAGTYTLVAVSIDLADTDTSGSFVVAAEAVTRVTAVSGLTAERRAPRSGVLLHTQSSITEFTP
jgi:adhesin/invasin